MGIADLYAPPVGVVDLFEQDEGDSAAKGLSEVDRCHSRPVVGNGGSEEEMSAMSRRIQVSFEY